MLDRRVGGRRGYPGASVSRYLAGRIGLYLIVGLLGSTDAYSDPVADVTTGSDGVDRVLVVGATGRQGGAVARELLARGHVVRGLTRDPGSARAAALGELGVEMVAGDLDDRASLDAALDAVDGVFLMTSFWEHGYDGEIRHGRNMVAAAGAAGVRHLVYSSVGSADRDTGIPHFDSKYEVEKILRSSGLGYTIIRPVSFMENWAGLPPFRETGRYQTPLRPQARNQYISVRDIGRFAAEAFADPAGWNGVALDIAGDEYTVAAQAGLFGRVLGRTISIERMSWDDYRTRSGHEMTIMMQWFDRVGYDVDVPELRERFPWMVGFEDYLRDEWTADR